jgi:hypothetical protein
MPGLMRQCDGHGAANFVAVTPDDDGTFARE